MCVRCFLQHCSAHSTAVSAQSPFDGTWKTNTAQTKFSPKPNVFYLSQGWYHCVSCNPAFDVKADGTDQAVTGQSYDTISVKEADPNSIAVTAKKDGKPISNRREPFRPMARRSRSR